MERHIGNDPYLSLPFFFARNRSNQLQYIIQTVRGRIQNWNNICLSQAGKEVMLKAAAQSISVYSMSCFNLAQLVIYDINLLLTGYW